MLTVHMGLFSSLFKKIYNAIIQPVVDFFGGLLNSVFTWVFDNILKPLLVEVLFPLFKGLLEMIYEIIAGILYDILATLLKVVDMVQTVFNVFAGIDTVTYKDDQYYLIDLLFSNHNVQYSMLIIASISVVLLMAFSIMAVLRSISDLSGEMKNPVGKVLRLTGSGFLKIMMVPLVCLLLIRLSGVILQSVYTGINTVMNESADSDGGKGNSQTTLGRTIFCITTLDAAKTATYNTSSNPDGAGIHDGLRAAYYYSDYNGQKKDFGNSSTVEADFKFSKMNFIVGFGVGILFLYIMASCSFKFINRIFNVMILYIISPFYARWTKERTMTPGRICSWDSCFPDTDPLLPCRSTLC